MEYSTYSHGGTHTHGEHTMCPCMLDTLHSSTSTVTENHYGCMTVLITFSVV